MDVSVKTVVRSLLALLVLAATTVSAERVQFRWVDENGNVLFTDAPPNGVVYQIYRNGVAREKVHPQANEEPAAAAVSNEPKMVPIYTEEQKQLLSDRLLLLKYASEQDIEEARQVEQDHLRYDFRLRENESKSLIKSMQQLIRSAADSQRAQKPVADTQVQKIEGIRERLLNNMESIAQLEERSRSIDQEFEATLQRYRRLTSQQVDTG